jgi:hypothetical protein
MSECGIAEHGMPAAWTAWARQPVVSTMYSSARLDSFPSGAYIQHAVHSMAVGVLVALRQKLQRIPSLFIPFWTFSKFARLQKQRLIYCKTSCDYSHLEGEGGIRILEVHNSGQFEDSAVRHPSPGDCAPPPS